MIGIDCFRPIAEMPVSLYFQDMSGPWFTRWVEIGCVETRWQGRLATALAILPALPKRVTLCRVMPIIPLLLVAGCFVSKQPLISPASASWPLKDGQRVTLFNNCAAPKADEEKCNGRKDYVRQSERASFHVTNGGYIFTPIPALPETSEKYRDRPFLFKGIGDGFYLMQGDVNLSDNDHRSMYVLTRFDGTSVYYYFFACEKGDWPSFPDAVLKHARNVRSNWCEVNVLNKLTRAFRRRVAMGAVPDFKWELEP
jgi:hypothetical protein